MSELERTSENIQFCRSQCFLWGPCDLVYHNDPGRENYALGNNNKNSQKLAVTAPFPLIPENEADAIK
jgi:hypothetical protein